MAGLRAFCYSQVTYVTASMLANSLPKTDLRIVQVGGGIKELYYYPSTTVQVCIVIYHSRLLLRVSAALSGYQAWQRSIANAIVLETCRCMELKSHSATLSAPGVLPADMRVYAVPVTPAHSVKQLKQLDHITSSVQGRSCVIFSTASTLYSVRSCKTVRWRGGKMHRSMNQPPTPSL